MLYLLRKILGSVIAVLTILIIMFFLSTLVPGDAAKMAMGKHYNETTYELLSREMRTGEPTMAALTSYLKTVLMGDLGRSFVSRHQVTDIIGQALPVTIKLCLVSLVLALVIGISLGALSAYKENTVFDRLVGAISVAGFSLPHFWLALLLQIFFGLTLKILPVSGIGEGQLYFFILPGLAIGIPLGMAYTRLVRSFLLEVLGQPFVKAALGWGLPQYRVFIVHVLPNFTYLLVLQVATDMAFLLSGAVVAEAIFALPGMGSTLVSAVLSRDWPVVHGIVLVTTVLVASLNLTIRIFAPLIDPRLGITSAGEGGPGNNG